MHTKYWLGNMKENLGDKVLGERTVSKTDTGEIECEDVY
jgi:hypothetical protein